MEMTYNEAMQELVKLKNIFRATEKIEDIIKKAAAIEAEAARAEKDINAARRILAKATEEAEKKEAAVKELAASYQDKKAELEASYQEHAGKIEADIKALRKQCEDEKSRLLDEIAETKKGMRAEMLLHNQQIREKQKMLQTLETEIADHRARLTGILGG